MKRILLSLAFLASAHVPLACSGEVYVVGKEDAGGDSASGDSGTISAECVGKACGATCGLGTCDGSGHCSSTAPTCTIGEPECLGRACGATCSTGYCGKDGSCKPVISGSECTAGPPATCAEVCALGTFSCTTSGPATLPATFPQSFHVERFDAAHPENGCRAHYRTSDGSLEDLLLKCTTNQICRTVPGSGTTDCAAPSYAYQAFGFQPNATEPQRACSLSHDRLCGTLTCAANDYCSMSEGGASFEPKFSCSSKSNVSGKDYSALSGQALCDKLIPPPGNASCYCTFNVDGFATLLCQYP